MRKRPAFYCIITTFVFIIFLLSHSSAFTERLLLYFVIARMIFGVITKLFSCRNRFDKDLEVRKRT
jgi:hypothetical protein